MNNIQKQSHEIKHKEAVSGRPRIGLRSPNGLHEIESNRKSNLRHELSCSSRICPKFISCSAPVCPLDNNWRIQRHLPGERVCRWLREAVKKQGELAVMHALPYYCSERVIRVAAVLLQRQGELGSKLKRASKQGSKSTTMPPWVRKAHD